MALSRWSDSCWYVYADVSGGLTICLVAHLSDEEIKSSVDACIQRVKDATAGEYTEAEYEELRGLIEKYKKRLE